MESPTSRHDSEFCNAVLAGAILCALEDLKLPRWAPDRQSAERFLTNENPLRVYLDYLHMNDIGDALRRKATAGKGKT